jgi:hypothetical protein
LGESLSLATYEKTNPMVRLWLSLMSYGIFLKFKKTSFESGKPAVVPQATH